MSGFVPDSYLREYRFILDDILIGGKQHIKLGSSQHVMILTSHLRVAFVRNLNYSWSPTIKLQHPVG